MVRKQFCAAPEAFALPDNVVSKICIHVSGSLVALLGHKVRQLLLVIICKVPLPLTIVKPLHL